MSRDLYKTKMRNTDINVFWIINGALIALILSFVLSENDFLHNIKQLFVVAVVCLPLLIFTSFVVEQSFRKPFAFFWQLAAMYKSGFIALFNKQDPKTE